MIQRLEEPVEIQRFLGTCRVLYSSTTAIRRSKQYRGRFCDFQKGSTCVIAKKTVHTTILRAWPRECNTDVSMEPIKMHRPHLTAFWTSSIIHRYDNRSLHTRHL